MASVPTWGVADRLVPGPPPSRREELTETIHGLPVSDPYRWLEDGESSAVVEWVAAQNRFTRQALDARPSRDAWHERLSALVALPTVLGCSLRGGRCFVLERRSGADQFSLVERLLSTDSTLADRRRTLLDPASLATDAAVAIDWFEPDAAGGRVAVGLSEGGTEQSVLRVLDVSTGQFDQLVIRDTRAASVAWAPDGSGFWYTRYPAGDQYHRHVRWHSMSTHGDDDPVVFDRLPTPEAWPDVQVSPDGSHLLVHLAVGWLRTDVHLLDLAAQTWQVLVEGVDASTSLRFGPNGLVGRTTIDAPNGRIVTVDLARPQVEQWTTLVPEREGMVLGEFGLRGDEVIVAVSQVAVDSIERWSLDGLRRGGEAGMGPVSIVQVEADSTSGHAAVVVSSFAAPTSLWLLEPSTGSWVIDRSDGGGDAPALAVSQLSYPSLDGTEIGLFVMHRPDVVPAADVPLILNGYGGFAITESPQWIPNLAAWCAAGGVWAIAGLRGGHEHGDRWHQAGRRHLKQNVFDDFHAAGDWLVAQGMASHERMALVGGSNGGLLVGAALTQRPDLARAVWCAVPLLDMVRFPNFLIARLWTDEYGDPDVAEEFAWLYAYSPYHAVESATEYPSVLFTTAEGDTRVDPLHARKMAALLQHESARSDERPVMLWQASRAGHGVGKPASMRCAEGADVLSFLAWQLGTEADMAVELQGGPS